MFNTLVEKLKVELSNDLPGQDAQYKMVPEGRLRTKLNKVHEQNPKIAGVMLFLYPVNNVPYLVLMQRNVYPGVHSNQISFPGGKQELTDEDLTHTALRESYEELGIESSSVNVIGGLTQVYIPPSNFLVQPIVGYSQEKPDFIPHQREVTEVIEVPLSSFQNEKNLQNVTIDVRGQDFTVPAFVISEKVIWGATAMILSEFLAITERA